MQEKGTSRNYGALNPSTSEKGTERQKVRRYKKINFSKLYICCLCLFCSFVSLFILHEPDFRIEPEKVQLRERYKRTKNQKEHKFFHLNGKVCVPFDFLSFFVRGMSGLGVRLMSGGGVMMRSRRGVFGCGRVLRP